MTNIVTNPHGTDPDIIAFCGDWHGDGIYAERAIHRAARSGAQVLVHTGDFGFKFNKNFMRYLRHALTETDAHLYFVRGNHDDPDLLDRRWPVDRFGFGEPIYPGKGSERIHYIPQGARWSWWGLTFLGLGGAHSVDREWRTPMWDWWPNEWISPADCYHAVKGGKVDVMITHDLPASCPLPNDRKSGGWPEAELIASEEHRLILQSVVDEVQPKLLVHGHFHVRHENQVGGLHVVGLDMNGAPFEKNLYLVGPDLIERKLQPYDPADYALS